ncbi:hypothetical protein ES703_95792 [subsurface metagenome]
MLLFFHTGVDYWYVYIMIHIMIIALIIILIPVFNDSDNKIIQKLRWWYPVLLFIFNYKEINSFTHILVTNWKDSEIMRFEKFIFGTHPTLWLEKYVSPLLTEFLKFDYFSYYLMIPVGAGILYFSNRRKEYVRYLSTVCLAFYISYLGFILYPVRGPRYTLHDMYKKNYTINVSEYYGPFVEEDVAGKNTKALRGYFFTNLQDNIMRYGSLHGGCMPSAHIAVAFVCMMIMFLYKRKVFYVYLPFVAVLCVAVVYNRYHYVSDVVAGLLVGVVSLYLTPIFMGWWDKFND